MCLNTLFSLTHTRVQRQIMIPKRVPLECVARNAPVPNSFTKYFIQFSNRLNFTVLFQPDRWPFLMFENFVFFFVVFDLRSLASVAGAHRTERKHTSQMQLK